ncbi:MAG: class II glutamine amidotransferase [Pirellulales bacterium]
MCRWLAYTGSPIYMDSLLLKPEHSLIDQSRRSQRLHTGMDDQSQAAFFMNGDGVGLGWYNDQDEPGVYRDIQPAWNDHNLRSLAQHTQSSLFLAHVRASSGTAIQRTNCHPFRFEKWLFQHNGSITNFAAVKRDIDLAVDADLYARMEGSTDSERMFYLALTFGLVRDPPRALARMAGFVETVGRGAGSDSPLRMTVAVSDGQRIFAVRYGSGDRAPTLFHNRSTTALKEVGGQRAEIPDDAIVVLSEPLDHISDHWEEIPPSTLLVIDDQKVTTHPFEPIA